MHRLNRNWLAILLALASAALTLLLYFALQPARQSVVIARREVQPFSAIRPEDITVIQVDERTASSLFPNAYQEGQELAGTMALRRLRPNEVLVRSDPGIARQEQLAGVVSAQELPISYLIPAEHRAVPVSVGLPSATPGDYVELYLEGESRPILDRPVQVVVNEGGSLLVLVTAADVDPLLSAQSRGELKAVLTAYPTGQEASAWSG